MSAEPLRLVVVGAGTIAAAYVDTLTTTGAVVVGVVDVNLERAESVAARAGCAHSASTLHELPSEVAADAALICTPPDSHAGMARLCIERGLNVLCEKPFAITPTDSRDVIARARRASRVVTMAAKFRSVGDVIEARRLVAHDAIGSIVSFENTFASRVPMAGRWNSDPSVSGGGVIIDNGTHSVDLARFFLGPITEVLAVEGPRLQTLEVEDSAQLSLRTASGALATIDLSWSVDHAVDHYVRLVGSRGQMELGWRGSRWRATDDAEWTPFGSGYDKRSALAGQVAAFVGAVRGRERGPAATSDIASEVVSHDDVLASVDVIAAAYRSLAADQWAVVEPTPRALAPVERSA